jgi:poly(3-hydroxyalkanoate) synthetase
VLAYGGTDGDDRINAITMMVCVLEPKPGDTEASSLVSHNGIALAKQRAAKKGVIEGSSLARGFAWLRPNDLIWNYVINNYLLGDDPPAFDILVLERRCDQPVGEPAGRFPRTVRGQCLCCSPARSTLPVIRST